MLILGISQQRFIVPLSSIFNRVENHTLLFIADNKGGCIAEEHLPALHVQIGHVLRVSR